LLDGAGMTAIDEYRRILKELIEDNDIKKVLEVGVEKGISTKVFCDAGCDVLGVDVEDLGFRNENLLFAKGDIADYFDTLAIDYFDLIYLDAFYTYERLENDVPEFWKSLKVGGLLVFNEYIDFANHRNGEVRKFVHRWANENMRPFKVYPLRNGQAVFIK